MDLNFEELISDKTEIEIQDYLSIQNDCFVDLSEEIKPPEIILSIGEHEYKKKMYPTAIMTAGEFSAIIAVSKAKKSFIKSAFIGCYIGGASNILFGNIKSHRDQDYTILDFDTEQGYYYAQRTFRRVQDITQRQYDNYKCYATRHLTSLQRLQLIEYCLKNQSTLYKTPVKLVSIDGIADLVENTNDIMMSKEASDYLMRWTHEYNIHVTTVIHKSGVTGKPLGHLGTYVLKKTETVIELEVNEDKTINVSNPYSRGVSFEPFNFDVNSDSLPYLIEDIY
jgi:hypothetical protein